MVIVFGLDSAEGAAEDDDGDPRYDKVDHRQECKQENGTEVECENDISFVR